MGSHFSGPARQRLGMQRREAASEPGQPLSVVREGSGGLADSGGGVPHNARGSCGPAGVPLGP